MIASTYAIYGQISIQIKSEPLVSLPKIYKYGDIIKLIAALNRIRQNQPEKFF